MRIRTLVIAALALALSACSALAFGTWDNVRGNGTVRLESRDAPSFTGIENQGSGLVRFSQGSTRQVTVEADTNILPYIETEVQNGVLVLRTRPGISINPTRLVFRITVPELRTIGIQGSGDFRMETPLETDRLEIEIEGSGSIEGEIAADDISVEIRGSGDVSLGGTARLSQFDIDGSGDIEAADLSSVDARVVIQGSGSVTLQVTGSLDVEINGSGSVRYRGGAKVTVRSSGSGTVREY
ncbi:MAG: DUF2807 domain-containing protein [Spirochaetes bacterium]|nr:DUF2807 domain-containing protein [Spirochaetota bacterium]